MLSQQARQVLMGHVQNCGCSLHNVRDLQTGHSTLGEVDVEEVIHEQTWWQLKSGPRVLDQALLIVDNAGQFFLLAECCRGEDHLSSPLLVAELKNVLVRHAIPRTWQRRNVLKIALQGPCQLMVLLDDVLADVTGFEPCCALATQRLSECFTICYDC